MGAVRQFFSSWWTLTILAAVLAALILALGLPIFVAFLRPWWVRLLVVLTITLIWAIFALIHVLRARRASDAIAEELAKPQQAGDEEAQTLARRMAEALAGLKKAAGNKRDYLYSRPWYVIIGPPGAGKTTALLNSGLRFPFSDSALKGVGGTRNLDFWFADEAALVDTAGRYTTQDSDAPADARAWESFLTLLRKHRPLQPINGVLVAIGLDELLRADRAQIDAHASAVRRRLQELRRTLEVAAPVYVLFTKADLLAGFVEFYDDLDVEGRRAVSGATLPWGKPLNADMLASEFDQYVQSIADRTSKRLQEEPDARRRGLILGYASQMEGLRSRVLRFLEGAFIADRERDPREPLRGFYLTSGVQEGAPLDRILAGVASVYDQPRTARDSQGRAYFLNRLLDEVVFAEAGLVQTDAKAKARRTGLQMAGFAAIGAVTLLTLVLWMVSFVGNRALQRGLLTGAQSAQEKIHDAGIAMGQVSANDPPLDQVLDSLNALRDLPGGYAERQKHGPKLFNTFGLYQRGLSQQAQATYLTALQRILLPRVLLRLEDYLHTNQTQAQLEYEPLKTYLMLGAQGPMDAASIKAWVENDWATNVFPGDDRASIRKALGQHLDALLAEKDLGSVWQAPSAPLDGNLIRQARQTVQGMSVADRAYAILQEKGATAGGPDWVASDHLNSAGAQAFASGDAVLKLTVPYFFTRDGYEKVYVIGLPTVEQDLKKEQWVLGQDAGTSAIQSQFAGVGSGVAATYAQNYIAAWEKVISALQPANYFGNPQALSAFTVTPSPLKVVLLEVVKNTTFTGGVGGAAQGLLQQKLASNALVSAVATPSAGSDAAATISGHFQPLQTYVGDGKSTTAPIDTFVTAVQTAAAANGTAQATTALGGGGPSAASQMAPAIAAVKAAAAGAPPQLQGFAAQAAAGGSQAAVSTAQSAVTANYLQNLATPCTSVVQDHYPFYVAAPADAQIADLMKVFGPNDQFDAFTTTQLNSLLDTSGPVWRWQANNQVAASLDPTSAEQFHRAQELRDLLSSGAAAQVAVASFGAGVTSAEFDAGGQSQTYKFDASNVGPKPIMWSISGLPEAHVTLFNGAKVIGQYPFQGPWALFKLLDAATKTENSGPTAFIATFGQGAATAAFKIVLPSDRNPFSRGGLRSFRCPATL